jgi:hypothetical protein
LWIVSREVGNDSEHRHPTPPSKLISSSFCASTANSIGHCRSANAAGGAIPRRKRRSVRIRCRGSIRSCC